MPAIVTKRREGLPWHIVTPAGNGTGPFRFTFKAKEQDNSAPCFVTIERAGTEAGAKATLKKLGWVMP